MPLSSNRISDEMLYTQVERAVSYTGISMRLSLWTPGDSRGSRYQFISEDDVAELSHVMNKSNMYSNLYTLNQLFHKIHVIKLRRFQETIEEEKKKKKQGQKKNKEQETIAFDA
jgi:hypothetical protein